MLDVFQPALRRPLQVLAGARCTFGSRLESGNLARKPRRALGIQMRPLYSAFPQNLLIYWEFRVRGEAFERRESCPPRRVD